MEKLTDGIYRICIPFFEIYTTSFILTEGNDAIILDSGSSDADAKKYIIPEVLKSGFNVRYLISSHTHSDHHGGIEALKKAFPTAIPALFDKNVKNSYHLSDGEMLLGRFKAFNLKGHSEDSIGILDTKTDALVTCDSLQLYGILRWKTFFYDKQVYLNTIERVRTLAPKTIIASHDYATLGFIAKGADEVSAYLDECIAAAEAADIRQ